MKNIFKSLFLVLSCLAASTLWATPIADLNFEITSSSTAVPTGYVYSSSNTPSIKTQNSIKCIIVSDGGGSTAPTFNDPADPSGGKRWMAFCPDVDCDVTIGIMSNKKKFFIQTKEGEFFAHTNTANAVEEKTVTGLKAGKWYAMCGGSSQVYITKMTFTAAGPVISTDNTLKSLTYNGTSVPSFSPTQLTYDVELPAGTTAIPTVAAEANDTKASAVVTQATQLPGTASVKVTAESGAEQTYTINFTVASSAPKVTSATWANILGTATINQVNHTITGMVKNGSSLTLEPSFGGDNIQSWFPNGPQDFSQGAIEYIFMSSTSEQTPYMVTITEAPAVSDDATLKSLTYGGTSVPGFSPSKYVYNIELTAGIKTPPTIAAEANHAKATLEITQAQSVPGSGKVVVTAEDKSTTLTYTINYTVQVPVSGLTTHLPEIYEARMKDGGYGGTLKVIDGHEYEVYYASRNSSSSASLPITAGDKVTGIEDQTSATANYLITADGWMEAGMNSISGGTSAKASASGEFSELYDEWRMASKTVKMDIQGFDQFSYYGADKNIDIDSKTGTFKKEQRFQVFIDGIMQPETQCNTNPTVRRYDITTGRHTIEVTGMSGGDSKFYGFSLRVAQEPRTKYLKGNDSSQVILQTTAPRTVRYFTKYNSKGKTQLEWDGPEANGISLTTYASSDMGDTLVLGGVANCPVGEYKYNVVAYYNDVETSRASGKFKVISDIKSTTDIKVNVYQNEDMEQIIFNYYALDASDVHLTWPNGTPGGTVAGSGNAGKYIIQGTPANIGTFPYEISVTGADTVIKGQIKVDELNYGENPVLYLYKSVEAAGKDGVGAYIQSTGKWNIIQRKAKVEGGLRPADQYAKYKWILISEDVDADNPEVLAIARGEVNLPVLNMKSFTYTPNRLDWGEPDNGSLTQDEGRFITVWREDHPIFKALNKKHGDRIQMLDTVIGRGLMPAAVDLENTFCLATARTRDINNYYGDGKPQTFLHEIPVSERPNGKKYICMPIGIQSSARLTEDGKKFIAKTIDYLLSNDPAPIQLPNLEITKFMIGTHEGKINDLDNTIVVTVPYDEEEAMKTVSPVITLAEPTYTFCTPKISNQDGTVDFSNWGYGVYFVVSDYINTRTYNVQVQLGWPEAIETVYTPGEWVNIYDMMGRKLTTTNQDIYTMALPAGVYIIATQNGTFKISK